MGIDVTEVAIGASVVVKVKVAKIMIESKYGQLVTIYSAYRLQTHYSPSHLKNSTSLTAN